MNSHDTFMIEIKAEHEIAQREHNEAMARIAKMKVIHNQPGLPEMFAMLEKILSEIATLKAAQVS